MRIQTCSLHHRWGCHYSSFSHSHLLYLSKWLAGNSQYVKRKLTAATLNVQCALQAVGSQSQWQQTTKSAMSDSSHLKMCIWLISNETQAYYDATAGCYLAVPVKGGHIQRLDHMHRHSGCACMTQCHLDLSQKELERLWGQIKLWCGQPCPLLSKTIQKLANLC